MKALIRNNVVVAISDVLDGWDQTDCIIVDGVPEPCDEYVWSAATQSFVVRPPNNDELVGEDFRNGPWVQLKNASPAQIDNWLNNNVTDLASARQVLAMILRGLRILALKSNI